MKFKNDLARGDYSILPAFLRKVCDDFETFSLYYGVEPVVTRVREAVPEDSGVHEACRAVDFRSQYSLPDGTMGWLYTAQQAEDIVYQLNRKYPRDDGKPTCMHHSFEGGPFHFHIQIQVGTLFPGEPKPRPEPVGPDKSSAR